MSEPILRVRNVGWHAGQKTVLEQVTIDVAPGEFVAVMGRNGAGKSTLIEIIAGLRTPSEGMVTLLERPLNEWPAMERARLMAHLPQSVRADLSVHAEALVLMGRYVHASGWFESHADRDIAEEAMRRCECLEFRRRLVGTLSGGERQRVLLAACLAQRARVLLLDEPATFLDVDQQLRCFSLLQAEARRGTTCLAVTHDINLALRFCARLIVLAEHTVAYDLPAATALNAPEWLRVFSHRLEVHTDTDARPWVTYQ